MKREPEPTLADVLEELDLAWKLLAECEHKRKKLEKRVADLLADLTAINRMDGKE